MFTRSPVFACDARRRCLALCALFVSLALVPGCSLFAPTLSVHDVGSKRVYDELSSFVLDAEELSTASLHVLHSFGLSEIVEDDAHKALVELDALNELMSEPKTLFALAELSYFVGLEEDDRDAFLASAIYAYRYLFEGAEPPSPFDRRFRWACDLYNIGLMRGLLSPDGEHVELTPGLRTLPVGKIKLAVDRSRFPWSSKEYPELLPADQFAVRGLALRLRDPGLGVPLIALPRVDEPMGATLLTKSHHLSQTPATLFLRLGDGAQGTLELTWSLDVANVAVGESEVPLESDFSVVLAHGLERSPLWKFSLSGLFEGDAAVRENSLLFVRRPVRGRIPVVFVHGTASNPAYWADMYNELLSDPVLRERTQSWFYQYATGNPLVLSAMTLREQLEQVMHELDPDGTDPDLQRVVIIGHSQGGLVTKLMAVDGSVTWFESMAERPLSESGFDDEQLAFLARAFEFDPLPFMTKVIYLATPHRGSFQAEGWAARMLAKLIKLPVMVEGMVATAFDERGQRLPSKFHGRVPTSIENMNPGSALLKRLVQEPVADWVTAHSIIPIGDADPNDPAALAEADDGVVEYTSARVEPVASELLVPTGHSCQSDSVVIREVRRILRAHVLEE